MRNNVFFALAAVLMMVGCRQQNEDENYVVKDFETMTVSKQDMTLEQSFPAQIEGRQSVRIIPRVEGYLREIRVKEGQQVKRGQVLFVIDQSSFQAEVKAAEANVADSINAILFGHHPRLEPVKQATLDKADYDRILQIYQERFSDASNFNTVIIGNYDLSELRPLLCQYLASLPSTNKGEKTNYANVPKMVEGSSVHRFVKQQATPLANVSVYYSANVPFSPKSDLTLDFLTRCLQIAYTDSVREEKGGTYGVSVSFNLDKDDTPNTTLSISYKADPKRYGELNPIIYKQLENIANHGPEPSSMQKVREYLVKQYDQVAITNDYWSYVVWHEIEDGVDFDKDYKMMVNEMTSDDVRQMARLLLDAKRCIEVTMLSE